MTAETTNEETEASAAPIKLIPDSSLIAVLVTVVLGDWLLWTKSIGISYLVFLVGLVSVHLILHWRKLERRSVIFGLGFFSLSILPVIEELNFLSFLLATGGTFFSCLMFGGRMPTSWSEKIDVFVYSSLGFTFRFLNYFFGEHSLGVDRVLDKKNNSLATQIVRTWIVPLLLALPFVVLFAMANPIWEKWVTSIDFLALLSELFSGRTIMWIAVAWFSWPFLEQRLPKGIFRRFGELSFSIEADKEPRSINIGLFQNSLILFNVIFAIQTLLDFTFLWGGASLPDGMSYASYAHRGAYPLVVAALLAAVFVIIAMRPDGAGEKSSMVKWLVLAWVGQNLLLVGSSVLRLNLYIEAYALTYWRIAALIWMMLVAIGLALIVLRFVMGKSSGWLFSANIAVLVGTLYLTSFVNLPSVIAKYNLTHSNLVVKSGPRLDWRYLRSLGPSAYPGVVAALEGDARVGAVGHHYYIQLKRAFETQVKWSHRQRWQAWGYRSHHEYWLYKELWASLKAEQ